MKKRVLSLLTTLVMAIGLTASLPTVAASAETSGDYEYSILDDGTVKIAKYNGTSTSVSIPSYIDGREVSTIGNSAFRGNEILTSITIPNIVVMIEDGNDLNMVNGSSRYGNGAFSGCVSLSSVKLSTSLLKIGSFAFRYCTSLKSISIPSSVLILGTASFNCCYSLQTATIGSSVSSIGDYTFGGCALQSITIPKSVTNFGGKNIFINYAESFSIKCYKDSIAENYATNNNIPYTLLDMTVPTVSVKSTYTSTSSAIRINWNKVSSATGYRIYKYNSSAKKWVNIKTIYDNTVTTYRASGLSAGTTYKFKVKAFTKRGSTYWGNASSTITTSTKPATATFTTASKTKTAIRLNWKKVTGASGYQIQKYNSSTKKWSTVKTITSGSTLTYRISGLKKGTVYKYRIRAYRTVNSNKLSGAWSATKKVTTKS